MPSSVLQPQMPHQAVGIVGQHLSYRNYLRPLKEGERRRDRVFHDNGELWRAVLSRKLHGHAVVTLEGFRLFEWFPRAPGLFYTPDAEFARRLALKFLDRRFSQAPINADHARGLGVSGPPKPAEHTLVLAPEGKLSMLEGGIGCVRLKPIQREEGVFWLMSASSTGVAHEGFPLAMPHGLYEEYEGIRDGSVAFKVVGELKFFPQPMSGIVNSFQGAPQLYLEVHELTPVPRKELEDEKAVPRTEVSVAVSFVSDYKGPDGVYATYVTFDPGDDSSFREAVGWLKHEYVEGGYRGRIITDFDQTEVHFPEAVLSLRKVMGRHLLRGEVAEAVELMHARGDADRLFSKLDLDELKGEGADVARTRVFISYSRKDARWLERVQTHLRPLTRENNVDVWADTKIGAGKLWKQKLDNALESARVAVLLVSANFYASDFIAKHELPPLLAAAESGKVSIIPIILSPCPYQDDEKLSRFQSVNDPARPVAGLRGAAREEVFNALHRAVRQALS